MTLEFVFEKKKKKGRRGCLSPSDWLGERGLAALVGLGMKTLLRLHSELGSSGLS